MISTCNKVHVAAFKGKFVHGLWKGRIIDGAKISTDDIVRFRPQAKP